MANPHLEMMKHQRALHTARPYELHKMMALGQLAKQKHDLQASLPDARLPMAEMLGQSAQQVTGPGGSGRPPCGWRALIAGMLEGASTGLKSKVAQEKQAQAEKLARFFSALEANTLAVADRNHTLALRQQAQEEIEPLLKDYAQHHDTLPPLAKEKYAEEMLKRYNQRTGTDYTLAAIDQVNPLKVAVTSPQQGSGVFVHDFSQQVGGLDAELYRKALAFEDRKFAQDQARLDLAQQNAKSYQADIESRWNPEKQFNVGMGKEAAKNLAKAVQNAEEENLTLEEALYATQEAKDLLATGKVIAGSDLGAYLQRLTGKAFNTEGMTITQLYDTAAAQLYEFAKGNISFGNTNQKEFEFLTSRIPESAKTPQALARMLERFEKKIERKMAKNEALIRKMPDYSPSLHQQEEIERGPSRRGEERGEIALPQQPQSSPQPTATIVSQLQPRTFRVQTPTGDIVLVPETDIDDAIAHGGKVIAP